MWTSPSPFMLPNETEQGGLRLKVEFIFAENIAFEHTVVCIKYKK